ncbi:MAG: glucose-1-phosphate adenylyltransferase subunit GlgD [Oscillospiraceae bacterium]|nr:glucose-1-phosphate adenylyltransferase subunit GlgD [Oscillospiraceae bacterium]
MSHVIGLISTNYTGANYGKLIEDRPVASIPFAGRYRLIDFALSSMVNSDIDTVGVITPANYRSLADHLNMGREWGLNKKQGGMFMLPGAVHGLKDVSARFSLRDVILNKDFFHRADEETVLFCAANRVYNIDFRPAIEKHEKTGAPVTLIYKKVRQGEHARGLFLKIGASGLVSSIAPSAKGEANCFLDSMLISRSMLLEFIDCYQNLGYIDIMDILSANLGQIQVNSWCYTGYEHAVDDAEDYMHVSQDLLRPEVAEELFNEDRPILTKTQDSPPAKYLPGARVKNSLIAASCVLEGTVENSILFRNVTIGKGAVVRNSVLMQHCVISPGAVVENVICDKYVTISPDVKLSGSEKKPFVIGKKQEL